jgi:hypothetical protein
VSKPLVPHTSEKVLGNIGKRLAALERAVASRRAQRTIITSNLSADRALTASTWVDLCSVTFTLAASARVCFTSEVSFVSTGAAGPQVSSAIYAGSGGASGHAAVQGGAIDLQGSTVATQPILNGTQGLRWELDLPAGTYTYTLAGHKNANGTAQANATRSVDGLGLDPVTFLQATIY